MPKTLDPTKFYYIIELDTMEAALEKIAPEGFIYEKATKEQKVMTRVIDTLDEVVSHTLEAIADKINVGAEEEDEG